MGQNGFIDPDAVVDAKAFQKYNTFFIKLRVTVLDDLFGKFGHDIFVLCVDGLDIIHDDLLLPVL